jgi:Arc/MetJ-type ribon-helix-helix transcriptional regulator
MTAPSGTRLKPHQKRKIEERVKRGEFDSMSDFIREAIIYYLYYLEERDFRLFIQSDEGKARIREISRQEVRDDKPKI